ncbi:hypothetical protein [Stenotrophomonas phage CM2]
MPLIVAVQSVLRAVIAFCMLMLDMARATVDSLPGVWRHAPLVPQAEALLPSSRSRESSSFPRLRQRVEDFAADRCSFARFARTSRVLQLPPFQPRPQSPGQNHRQLEGSDLRWPQQSSEIPLFRDGSQKPPFQPFRGPWLRLDALWRTRRGGFSTSSIVGHTLPETCIDRSVVDIQPT